MVLAVSAVWSSVPAWIIPEIEVVGINDPVHRLDYLAYMLKYDTMHGQFNGDCRATENAI